MKNLNLNRPLKYKQVADAIRFSIQNGEFNAGEKIFSENQLSSKYKISRSTVRDAIGSLVSEGMLFRHHGKGTFVADYSNKRKLIDIINPAINNPIFSLMVKGAEDTVNQNDYTAVLCNFEFTLDKERKYLERASVNDVKGSIIIPSGSPDSIVTSGDLKKIAKKSKVVVIDQYEDMNTTCVVSNDINGSYMAVKYLIELGHKQIVHIAGPQHLSPARDRMAGYKKALSEAGLVLDEELIIENKNYEEASAYKTVLDLITRNVQFTAIFAATDYLALGAYKAIKEKGLNIPKDISLIGYGDLEVGRNLETPLTTVYQPFYDMGKTAAEVLISFIEGNGKHEQGTKKIELPTRLVIKDSTSKCKNMDSSRSS